MRAPPEQNARPAPRAPEQNVLPAPRAPEQNVRPAPCTPYKNAKCAPRAKMRSPRQNVLPAPKCAPRAKMRSPRQNALPAPKCAPRAKMCFPRQNVLPAPKCAPRAPRPRAPRSKWASRVTQQPGPTGPALPDRRLRRSPCPGRPLPCALRVPRRPGRSRKFRNGRAAARSPLCLPRGPSVPGLSAAPCARNCYC